MDTRRFLFCCFQKLFSHMHSSVSTSAHFLPLLVAHVQCTDACNTAAEVFLLYSHMRLTAEPVGLKSRA